MDQNFDQSSLGNSGAGNQFQVVRCGLLSSVMMNRDEVLESC